MSSLTPETRALLARLGIPAPTIPAPSAPPSTSSPTTKPPAASSAPAVSVVQATRQAAKQAAAIEASQTKPPRKPAKKGSTPKVSTRKATPAKPAAPRPMRSPLSRPDLVTVNGIHLLDGTPICARCDVEFAGSGTIWTRPGCDAELDADIVDMALEAAAAPNFGRVVIPEAHFEAMADDLQALGLDADVLADATKGRRPTDEQIAVVKACRRMRAGDALRIIAYAGAGKTSTLKLCGATIGGAGIYLAFNKVIAQEGQRSFAGSGIVSKTCHSLAYNALGLRGQLPRQNGDWVRSHVPNGWLDAGACADVRPDRQAALTAKVFAKFCASDDAEPTDRHVADALDDAGFIRPRETPADKKEARKVERRMEQREALEPVLLRQSRAVWDAIFGGDGEGWRRAGKLLTFDSYLKLFERSPAVLKAAFRSYAFVLLDEAQDVNPVQISIVEQARAAGCRLIAVGDQFQQIYTWRGAIDALEILPGEALYLSASFRFGQAIAGFAEASLRYRPEGGLPIPLRGLGPAGRVVPADTIVAPVVLCRTNAGVLRAAGGAALKNKTVHVVGGIKEISDEYQSVLALQDGEPHRVTVEILRRFPDWKTLVDEAKATDDPDLRYFVDLGKDTETPRTIEAIRRLERPEGTASLVVSTAHKAKGREWDVVALADDFAGPTRILKRYDAAMSKADAAGMKAANEDFNVFYVAATRAKIELRVSNRIYDDIHG